MSDFALKNPPVSPLLKGGKECGMLGFGGIQSLSPPTLTLPRKGGRG